MKAVTILMPLVPSGRPAGPGVSPHLPFRPGSEGLGLSVIVCICDLINSH
ncbi:hypothetical protein J2Z17_002390 [Rhizobium halophytocola]|uniref:Uncharacterized protein n=1 Tax=Rhizobium halophytocola TaxID=735519 RepID=A0ABS4DZ35_9HYPH|nr:hypothetical protein [Rhizobium halophytocola]